MPQYAPGWLHVKTVDAGDPADTVITGMASTPAFDRQGHTLDPMGATFQNPLPLLLNHDQNRVIGTVHLHQPTPAGIPFTARLPQIATAGPLKDLIDTVRIALKAGLYTAVSVGWLPLERGLERVKQGLRIAKSEIVELSIVAVPANRGAAILSVKTLTPDPAVAAFRDAADHAHLAGVAAAERREPRREIEPMRLNEQIAALQATNKTTADRMNELMQPVLRKEAALTAEQQTEYDGLMQTFDDTELEVKRLEALERTQRPRLVPVSSTRSFQHVGLTVDEPELPPAIGFVRAVICQVAGKMWGMAPWDIAQQRYPSHPSIQTYLKAAVAGGTTTGEGGSPASGWGAALATQPTTLAGQFLEYLRPRTILGRVPYSQVPFNSRVQSATSGGSAAWVGQAKAKPVTKFDFDAITLGPAKVAAITVLADELVRFSTPSAEGRVRDMLTAACIERLDIDFIDPNKALDANVSPASITNGITPLSGSGGSDVAAVDADVQTLMGSFIDANLDPTSLVWIMPTTVALALSLLRNEFGQKVFDTVSVTGGTFAGFPVVASQYAASVGSPAGNIVILVAGKEIFVADDGGVTVDASNQASIEMSDDPEGDSGTVVSMYQTNQVALRAERYINWARGRDSAVAFMTGVVWGAAGSPA